MGIWKKLTVGLLTVLLTVSSFSGCSGKGEITSGATEKDYPVTVNGVTLKKAPDGVAVFSADIADVILAMGYEIYLKAKTAECDQEDLSVLPDVTVADANAVKNTGATLALFDKDPGEDAKSALSGAGIDVVVVAPAAGREDLERFYAEVGSAIQGGATGYKQGQKTAQDIFMTIDDITRVVPESDTPVTACYLYDAQGAAATGDTLAGTLIESAGLINGVDSGTGGKTEMSALKIADPQYVFCPTGLKAELQAAEGYKDLTAIREGRVYEMNPAYMTRQGRGMIQAVSFMAGTVHPELLDGGGSSSGTGSSAPGSSGSSSGESSGGAAFSPGATLKRGDKGDAVLAMQKRLDELGYMFVNYDGEYTVGTEQAVKDFQYLNRMEVTGVADPETQKKMNASDAKRREA